MEKMVYESNYLTLKMDEELQLLKVIWFPTTEVMQDEEFKKELTTYAGIAEKYRPTNSLVDTQNFLMMVVPETQVWVNENIHQRSLKAGIKKFAYLVSKDFFLKFLSNKQWKKVMPKKFLKHVILKMKLKRKTG